MSEYRSFLELAQERFSVRQFKDTPIEQEKLNKILESIEYAPTAGSFQPQRVIVVQSAEARALMQKLTPNMFHAPCALLVCYDKNASWRNPLDGYDSGQDEAAITATHMMFTAWELGIGSVWARTFDSKAIAKAFNIPSNLQICVMLTIGYPADNAKPSPMHFNKKGY